MAFLSMPSKSTLAAFATGLLWGVALTFIAGVVYLRHSLAVERECKAGVDETVAKIMENASKMPAWKAQLAGCGLPALSDGGKMTVLKLCNAEYAKTLTASPDDRKISCAIPCSIAIYEKPDGKTYMARMNMPLLGRLLGGAPGRLFPERIAPEQAFMLAGTLKGK